MQNVKKVELAMKKLEAAQIEFLNAVEEFRKVYTPKTVGLDGIGEYLEETMFDIQADIDAEFEKD